MAQSKDRFERAEVLAAALDPIIDICVRIGVNSTELESLVRVEFVRRLANTLPGNLRTGRGPSHEEIGLAAGLNRGEVQNILATGVKSAEMRMQKKARQHSKSERILSLWSKSTRYLSTSGLPLDLPLELQPEAPSFSELVDKALPGKLPKTVLKELRRRGLVQLLPDEIVRYRKTTALPTELNTTALAYAADDEKSAMKFLDEAAINYGKAIDAKPAEKYFLDPQKRIETAIAHYKELEEQGHSKVVAEAAPDPKVDASSKAANAKALTNAQVIAMVKSGMEDDTVIQAIRSAKAANFDLSSGGQQQLTSNGVSTQVVAAMKTRGTRKAVAAK